MTKIIMPPSATIKETRMDTIEQRLICPCGTEMERSPEVLTSAPPQYNYKCPKCGIRDRRTECLPRTIVRPIQ